MLLGQVKQLVTEVGCKRPVLVKLAVIFDITLQDAKLAYFAFKNRFPKPLNVGVLFILK